jgi:hypothetical protein
MVSASANLGANGRPVRLRTDHFKGSQRMISKCLLRTGVSALAVAAVAAFSGAATAKIIHPLGPGHSNAPASAPFKVSKGAGPWTYLKNSFPGPTGPETPLLMTDGTVMIHAWCSATWWRLKPDSKGDYSKGTWSQAGSFPTGYMPFFFATQVLSDGRLIANGGEYNAPSEGNCGGGVWTNRGALYDPVKDKWTTVNPPTGWQAIGDAQSVILADGSYMLADAVSALEAIATIKGTKVTWKPTGTGKADRNDEEGWTLLPNGKLLTVDASRGITGSFSFSEIYDPKRGSWGAGPNTTAQLVDASSSELGPGVLRPDGTVIYFGGAPNNSLYDSNNNTWSAAPPFPLDGYHVADGPGVIMPNGKVLVEASTGPGTQFLPPAHFFEYDDSGFTQVDDPTNANKDNSFEGRFLTLPSGGILYSNDGQPPTKPIMAVYNSGGSPNSDWLPVISKVSATLSLGSKNNKISGKKFNGFSFGAYYGDDAQESSNFPIVMIKNKATGDICFARSHDFSSRAVASTKQGSAKFDIPSSCESGDSTLTVAVNGISSKGVAVSLN